MTNAIDAAILIGLLLALIALLPDFDGWEE